MEVGVEAVDGRALRGIRRRRSIVEAADSYFRSNGYAGTSLREFSASIGMSHSGVLRHFASKSQLLQAVLEGSPAAPLPEHAGSASDQIIQAMRERRENPHRMGLYFSLLGEASSADHPAHDTLAEEIGARTAWIEQRVPGQGALLSAVWDGLEILARFLGESIDPVAIMQQMLAVTPASAASALMIRHLLDEAPSATPEQSPHGETSRDQILAAAAAAFAEEGYRAASIRSIATRLGIAHGTILYHFGSKEELLDGVLSNQSGASDVAALAGTGPDTLAQLWSRIVANESRTDIVRVYSSLLCEASSPSHPAHEFFRTRYERVLARFEAAHVHIVEEHCLRSSAPHHIIAAWVVACWDGLQIHRNFAPAIDVPAVMSAEFERIL
ncbi:MAG: helix-turn-helix transcriptional regulator [Actinobacteria bacterium]|nr:helix-turn-helix transcriptional regulator [Actinomycetota bacterium]